jgi:hypothetical protein
MRKNEEEWLCLDAMRWARRMVIEMDLTYVEAAILYEIACHVEDETGLSKPGGLPLMMQYTRMRKETVQKGIKLLLARGENFLKKKLQGRHYGGQSWRETEFILTGFASAKPMEDDGIEQPEWAIGSPEMIVDNHEKGGPDTGPAYHEAGPAFAEAGPDTGPAYEKKVGPHLQKVGPKLGPYMTKVGPDRAPLLKKVLNKEYPLTPFQGEFTDEEIRKARKRKLAAKYVQEGFLQPKLPKPDPAPSPESQISSREHYEFRFPDPPPVWLQFLEDMKLEIDEESFSTWIEPIRFLSLKEGELTVVVPSVFFRNWIMSNYQDAMIQTLERILNREIKLRYDLENEEGVG